jgi:DNA-binding NarL/FixJ family response regulator
VRILIVDGSAELRGRLRVLIEDSVVAEIAEVDALEDDLGAADVVILGVPLTRNGGLDELTRARSRFRDATIVVSTNDTSAHHRRECEVRGADYFFDKSREFDRTIEVIRARAVGPTPTGSGAPSDERTSGPPITQGRRRS